MPQALADLHALSQILDGVDIGFCAFDQAHRTLLWNDAFVAMFPEHSGHIHVGEPADDSLRQLVPSDGAAAVQTQQVLLDDGREIDVASVDVPGLGRASVWRARVAGLRRGGERERDEVLSRDELERGYRLLAQLSGDAIAAVRQGRLDYVSPSIEQLLGWRPEELAGREAGDLLAPEHASMLQSAIALGMTQPLQARARHADGSERWVEIRLTTAPPGGGTELLNLRDISARKAAELQLEQAGRELEALALTDPLTGAANRRAFDQGLQAEWRRCQRDGKPLVLLLFDIDFFKRLNDEHGHPAGDEALRRLAACLRGRARRPGDLAARFGGEEFAVILPATPGEGAVQIANHVREDFVASFADRPEQARTVSVGVAVAPADAGSAAQLLQRADDALYRAKAQGRDRCVRWTPEA
ncbi:diguanylate cyclase [Ramlibacter sp. G-1-2-2]|uniref:diguanylate cyclase n=1 Tax=Ramlibacter agri TaxID=2728837 RepID=A0A848H217_9BURK|nr:sensor domain-containing diguanylate cyclase [Ramlibacter agri]NML44614.1 diguanylate cyclase [Ramlibacter agri]